MFYLPRRFWKKTLAKETIEIRSSVISLLQIYFFIPCNLSIWIIFVLCDLVTISFFVELKDPEVDIIIIKSNG